MVVPVCAAALLLSIACSKDEKKPAASNAQPATTSTAAAKKGDKKKLPPKTAAKGPTTHGKKGGDGASKPTDKSHKAPQATVSSDKKHKVESADHPCEHAPDGAAECKGDELHFCAGKELWAVDCNTLMTAVHPELFTSGSCYETDAITDCMGLGPSEDDQTVACSSDLSTCCAEDGTCYVTH
jgi:hypothetical protein